MVQPPSGNQHELIYADQRLVVVEVGGGLRRYESAGLPLLDGYSEHEMCGGGRGQLLLPWPNRIKDGTYVSGGTALQLALSEPKLHNAIHGLVRWANWSLAERSESHLTLTHRLHPSPGYPFALECAIRYLLTHSGLTVRTEATNVGNESCPFGVGWHPYLRLDSSTIDSLLLRVPAETSLVTNEQQIPIGQASVAGTQLDFRAGQLIGSKILDTAYTELDRGADGRVSIRLENPESGKAVALWMDARHSHVMIFSGDTVHPENRRRQGLAVEPMTCSPNAFASGDGVRILDPGESFAAEWGITTVSPV